MLHRTDPLASSSSRPGRRPAAHRPLPALLVTLLACGLGACELPQPADPEIAGADATQQDDGRTTEPPPTVVSTSPPVGWLVTRLAAGVLAHEAAHGEGGTAPETDRLVQLQGADLWVAQGAGHEAWMATTSLPRSRLLVTSEGLDLLEVQERTHSHGPGGEHSHRGPDPRTWMDPALYAAQARTIHGALLELLPRRAVDLDRALATLEADLRALDQEVEEVAILLGAAHLGPWASGHPSYGYLARRLGLEIQVLEPDEWKKWSDGAVARGGQPVLLVDAGPDPGPDGLAGAESGPATVLVLDPLAGMPASPRTGDAPESAGPSEPDYHYLERFRANLERLRQLADSRPSGAG